MNEEILAYNSNQNSKDKAICDLLAKEIQDQLPDAESKIWHGSPVWFLDGNPITGYSQLKGCVRLLFWSGQSFKTLGLQNEGKFKAAEMRYHSIDQIDSETLRKWLQDSINIQWDYKNIVKRRGKLERLK